MSTYHYRFVDGKTVKIRYNVLDYRSHTRNILYKLILTKYTIFAIIKIRPHPKQKNTTMKKYYDEPPEPHKINRDKLPWLVRVHTLDVPEGAKKYLRTTVHEVIRPDGTLGFHFVNQYPQGASVTPIDVVNGHGYVIMGEQFRYPHISPDIKAGLSIGEVPDLADLARKRKLGRWSIEVPSGGVEIIDGKLETPVQAAIREAREEAGVSLKEGQLDRLLPPIFGSVSTNYQEFNLFAALLKDGQWDPSKIAPDPEEQGLKVAAYRLDTVVPEMINQGRIWEMSTVTALNSLWRRKKYRRYL